MKVCSKGVEYNYPDRSQELLVINKSIKKDFDELAKKLNISKSKLVQELYKSIILKYRCGELDKTHTYLPIAILRSSVRKRK